ncbi:hypothetical protein Mapa_012607 [Marchantia paleacea]|nr:hypothetical protein Mapa_012607 [Marchantia paleacea]
MAAGPCEDEGNYWSISKTGRGGIKPQIRYLGPRTHYLQELSQGCSCPEKRLSSRSE